MRISRIFALLLALCLMLCACGQQGGSSQTDPPVSGDQQTDADQNGPNSTDNNNDPNETPRYPAELMVELVVEWEATDALLSQLDDLADLLRTAIEEAGCPLDNVTVTISTAGGITAEALIQGGIDVAILPAVDIISHETQTTLIAFSGEEIPKTAIAVSQADEDLSDAFRDLLFTALTGTESGQQFLSICCGTVDFSAPNENSLQAVRDYFAEIEKAEGGHA